MRGHIWMTLLLVVEAQQLPPFRYHSWFYATPWRPLLPAPGIQQLSLGYTGPQTFPGAAGQAQPAARRPVVLDLVRPARQQFMLPFRPSPFAGYSNEQEEQQEQQREQELDQQEQPQQEPLFHAPGYPQATAHSKPIEELPAEALPTPSGVEPHFLYMSPGNLYQLVRS
ncbi:probable serine/threonine-protein kinase DDB_G0281745 [Drosophila novamexicana]|uniref:probable serine/threonine-protein kinase DDB_G0281745 n=1 Tax=Drosophila novamexicana TaxID=47314 RepID=UPI0011E603F6|nr:probable serine/threonine-protein kinase DDB_G0281745 [Drosophila novamexicana]